MTEDEAKKKVCVVRLIGTQAMMAGQLDPKRADAIAVAINDAGMCIGSACMMWRWEPIYGQDSGDSIGSGYCGLAGKP